MDNIKAEALIDIFQEYGILASDEQIESIAKDFEEQLSMIREMEMTPHLGCVKAECEGCKKLKRELADMERERDIYHKNVCIRRETNQVWIKGETVMYRPE